MKLTQEAKRNEIEKAIERNPIIKRFMATKEYDYKTLWFIYEVFDMVVEECIEHLSFSYGIDVNKKTEVALYNTDEYLFLQEDIFGKGNVEIDDIASYGCVTYDNFKTRLVIIHGHEHNIGMMNWMTDFNQFETLCNTIMELYSGQEYIVEDEYFTKEMFEIVQLRAKTNNAA